MTATLAPGLHFGVPDAVYFALPAISATTLKVGAARTLSHMAYAFAHPKEATDAMQLGSLTDCLVFEPLLFEARYYVAKIPNRSTNAGKAEWAAIQAAAGDKTIVHPDDVDAANIMADKILAHKSASRLLQTPGTAQATAVWWDDATGLLCKARIDRYLAGTIALDLKTTRNAAPGPFSRHAMDLGYHIQQAWYQTGLRAVTGQDTPFTFIAVDNEPPHEVAVYTMPKEAIDCAHATIRRLLDGFAEAQRSKVWPGYSDEVQELVVPAWALKVGGPSPRATGDEDSGF